MGDKMTLMDVDCGVCRMHGGIDTLHGGRVLSIEACKIDASLKSRVIHLKDFMMYNICFYQNQEQFCTEG